MALPAPASSKALALNLTAADAVWIATAMLHDRYPEAAGFSPEQIQTEVEQNRLTGTSPKTVYQHIVQHVTATKPANPNRRRMLTDTGNGLRRLFIAGDDFDPSRKDGQVIPRQEDLPPNLREWLNWYEKWSKSHAEKKGFGEQDDPFLALRGTGKHLFVNETGDEFLARLRSNWGGVE